MKISYQHHASVHSLMGPRAALPHILSGINCRSILDVGCGIGTWLAAASELSISDVIGIDGVSIADEQLMFPKSGFQQVDLEKQFDLHRSFDLVLCLEVAEHLSEESAPVLIDNLTRHSEIIVFSAACPGQDGQHHVNCQWPEYWQFMFNERGFSCSDAIRWRIWDNQEIEPWYRQNIFIAKRTKFKVERDDKIKRVIHPDLLSFQQAGSASALLDYHFVQLSEGNQPLSWYLQLPFKGLMAKIAKKLSH